MKKILVIGLFFIAGFAKGQNVHLPTNVQAGVSSGVSLPSTQIGSMYDSASWPTLGGFTTNSPTGFTAVSNHIHVACDASNTQYLRLPFTTMLDNYSVQIDFKVGTYTAASDFGLQIWMNSINSTSHANATVVAYIGAHTGADIGRAIFVTLNNGTGTNYLGGQQLASIATGDSITLIMTRTAGSYSLYAQNWTHASVATYSVPRSFTYASPTGFTNNTANIQITPAGSNTSTYDIYHIKFSSINAQFPALGIAGNSLTEGSYAGSATNRFSYLIGAAIMGGSGDETSSLVARLKEVVAITQPKAMLIEIGTNDIAFGVSSATWQANMQTIHDTIVNRGIQCYFLTPFPRNDVSTLPARTYILGRGWNYIDTYTLLVGSGTSLNATYDAGDGIHLNAAGHALVASTIMATSFYKGLGGSVIKYTSDPNLQLADSLALANVNFVRKNSGSLSGLTTSYLPIASSSSSISNSILQQTGTTGIGVGAAPTSGYAFDVQSSTTGTLAGIHGATNGFYYANWALANTAGNKIWNWVLLDNANMAFQTYNGTRVLTPQMWFTNGHSILDSATATTASDNGEWLSLGGAKVGVINDFRVHGYNLNFGDGAGSPIMTLNHTASGGGAQIQSQQGGAAAMGIDFNTQANFSGTANNINGRQLSLSDLSTGNYRMIIDAVGTTWWGAASNAYNFKILYKSAGLFTGSSIDGDGIFNARAGTSTLAQINLPAGTKKTTMNAGDLTYATGHLYFHDGSTDYDLLAGIGANPTTSIGLTANNGSATTFTRSDATHALSQSIVPTWTGVHTFSANVVTSAQELESLTISAAGTLTLAAIRNYIFTGTTTTWTLPAASASVGYRYKIKNEGSGNITVNAAGTDGIYSTSSVTSITVAAGSAVELFCQSSTLWSLE